MDDAFFTGYLDEHPELSSEFETFEQRMFVFHRGVGLAVKEGRFVSEKVSPPFPRKHSLQTTGHDGGGYSHWSNPTLFESDPPASVAVDA